MAELFRKPTNKEIQDTIDLLGDNLIFALVRDITISINKPVEKYDLDWFSRCVRLMLNNYSPLELHFKLFEAIEQKADEDWFENKYPKEVFMEMDFGKINNEVKKERDVNGTGITARVTQKISIIDIAKQFGLKIKGNKAVCPFHNDTNPSLIFNESRGTFKCFGCNTYGNIIKFYSMLKELNPSFVYKKENQNDNCTKT